MISSGRVNCHCACLPRLISSILHIAIYKPSKNGLQFEILVLKLVYTENFVLFGLFSRELLQFEYSDISLDLTGFCCTYVKKFHYQQQIQLKFTAKQNFENGGNLLPDSPYIMKFSAQKTDPFQLYDPFLANVKI